MVKYGGGLHSYWRRSAASPAKQKLNREKHMNEDRQVTIHFNNGTKMEVTFPMQIKNSPEAVMASMKKALESDELAIEAEGKLVIIPWSSIKHLEMTPAPPAVPFGVIKKAQISQ